MSNIAFIPVRGGSKSIPMKNIKVLNGKPLVYWTAAAASGAGCIDKVIIATDSEEIKKIVLGFELPKVEVYDRNPENCLLYTSPSPRDRTRSRMPSSA